MEGKCVKMADRKKGTLVISLDFELLWGVIDHETVETYGERILGARRVVPKILSLFKKYGIHATWGVVGLLANETMEQCIAEIPEYKPTYLNENISVYKYFDELKEKKNEPYLFAGELLKAISDAKYQEIASHTYSHYYCCEEGQSMEQFEEDITLSIKKLKEFGEAVSLIFPRNQFNEAYAQKCLNVGVKNYRGNEKNWIYRPGTNKEMKSSLRRMLRLLDAYFPITGMGCYDYKEIKDTNGLNNIRSSCFFRPYLKCLCVLEPLRLHRIKQQMKYAAVHGKVFHLWWHPHNFGKDSEKNLDNLHNILEYYNTLKKPMHFKV